MNKNLTVSADLIPSVATASDEICRINADGTTTYHWDRIEAAAQRWKPGCVDIAVCLSKVLLPLRPRRETEQEPVASQNTQEKCRIETVPAKGGLLSIHPPRREWVSLADESISGLWCKVSNTDFVTADTHAFARAIEQALKERNND